MFKHCVAIAALTAGLSAVPAAAVTNLVTNGSFETGSFSGWTVGASQGTTVQSTQAASDGIFQARLRTAGVTVKTLFQTVATTLGQSYTLSYDLRNSGTALDSLIVTSGTRASVFGDRGAFDYTPFTQSFTAIAPTTIIAFTYTNAYTALDQGAFFLDNVAVTLVPTATTVPEPSTWALLMSGFGLIGYASRRRRKTLAA